ncbi:MAG: hypothetical protein IPG25_15370 [Proteobacteria bacterium]|jgi:hypothetical protein|nr:hypothetical protein [Pseudomonadota bacterium]
MRPNHKRGYYTKDGAVIHAKKCPEGAREITQDEADAILAARPQQISTPPQSTDTTAYEELVRMVQIIAQKYDEQAIEIARQRSTIDAILKAKIPLDVKQERVA